MSAVNMYNTSYAKKSGICSCIGISIRKMILFAKAPSGGNEVSEFLKFFYLWISEYLSLIYTKIQHSKGLSSKLR